MIRSEGGEKLLFPGGLGEIFLRHCRASPARRQLTDYEKRLVKRCFIRIRMGAPFNKAVILMRREIALSRAEAHHDGMA